MLHLEWINVVCSQLLARVNVSDCSDDLDIVLTTHPAPHHIGATWVVDPGQEYFIYPLDYNLINFVPNFFFLQFGLHYFIELVIYVPWYSKMLLQIKRTKTLVECVEEFTKELRMFNPHQANINHYLSVVRVNVLGETTTFCFVSDTHFFSHNQWSYYRMAKF